MKVKQIVDSLNLELAKAELNEMRKISKLVVSSIEKQIKKCRMDAEVFIGGSFAKGTLVRREKYDIDLFVRFPEKYEDLDAELEKVLKNTAKELKKELKIIHGSRDYFAIEFGKTIFEIIPVREISKPKDASNSTDLSYFHVNYVKRKLKKNPRLIREIISAKAFCRAQGVYGAESWLRGFSGYALECLIIYYKGFEKMLRALIKANEQIVIDSEKKYNNVHEALIELNESKRKGPIVLIDPTYKYRNVCSALSADTFIKFKDRAKLFLKKPSLKFFEKQQIDVSGLVNKAKKKGFVYTELMIATHKQDGDIAGAKLEKFYRFFISEISKNYEVNESLFDFDEKQEARIYLLTRSKKELLRKGPPIEMTHESAIFKELHTDAFMKDGRWYSNIKLMGIKTFLENFVKDRKEQIAGMDVSKVEII